MPESMLVLDPAQALREDRKHMKQPPDMQGPPRVPEQFRRKVSAVCRSFDDVMGLRYAFDDETYCPYYPVLLMIPGPRGIQFQQIAGLGLAEVWELHDTAAEVWEKTNQRFLKWGNVVDFNDLRERNGLLRREDVPAATAEAFRERIRKHRANPITDPPRQPRYPNPFGRRLFPVGAKESLI